MRLDLCLKQGFPFSGKPGNFKISWKVGEFQNWSRKNLSSTKNYVFCSVCTAGDAGSSIDRLILIVKSRMSGREKA